MFMILVSSAFAADPATPATTPAATPAATAPAAAALPTLAGLDTNKDGKVSAAEGGINAALKAGWATADTNKDGSLDATEFNAWLAAQAKPVTPVTPVAPPAK